MRGSWAISRARPPRASARRSARRIVIARLVAAGVIGLIAAVAAVGALVVARSPVTAFEWSVRPREVAIVSSALVLITRDGASDARFSADTWDRAVLARVVTALARAGAAAIGIDVPLGLPGAPGRGGPTGDALLSQATALAGNVVFAIVPGEPVPALAQHARSVGHTLAPPDPDGVVRRIPVRAGVVDRSVLAWALALVAAARDLALDAIPVDRDGRALMTFTPLLPTLTFSAVWTAIDQGQRDRLQGLVDGKIVLLLLDPGSIERRTPVGLLSEGAIQAQVANAALTSSWRRDVPLTWTALAALVVATAVAWAFLTLRWWQAAGALVVVVAGYQAALHVVPQRTGVLLPIFVPLAAAGVAGAVAVMWRQICAFRRLRLVEGDVHAIRQALVRQESTVASLEEDLEAARAAVARSTGTERELLRAVEALRAQVAEAQSQEEATRRRLRELEGDGRVEPTAGRLSDVERQRLVERCAELGIITRDPDVLALFGDLERAAPGVGGRPDRRRQQSRSRARRRRGMVSRGPLFPAQGPGAAPPAAARQTPRHRPARHPAPGTGRRGGRQVSDVVRCRGPGATALSVARQRARAPSLPRAGCGPGFRTRARRGGSQIADEERGWHDGHRRLRGLELPSPAWLRHAGDGASARLGSQHGDSAAQRTRLCGARRRWRRSREGGARLGR